MVSFEELSLNIDVMVQIYQNLEIGDQLKLASSSASLKNIFEKFVWTQKYETLKISEKTYDFVIANETVINRICLQPEEIAEFQRHYARKVENLTVKNIVIHLDNYCGQDDAKQGRMLHKNLLNMGLFQNLKSLTYHYMSIPKKHLQLIAALKTDLEEFCLMNCCLDIGMDEVIQEFVLKMKNLKVLCLYNIHRFSLMYASFREILAMKYLERLELTAIIDFDRRAHGIAYQPAATPINLKELKIQVSINPKKWLYNFPAHYFTHVVSLTIEHFVTVNDDTLALIAHVCKNLKILHIRKTVFVNIKVFSIPPKVTELSLISCRGLNYQHLRKILTQLKITKFQSVQTYYEGVFDNFQISPSITCLNIDDMHLQDVKFLRHQNNLEQLTWHYLLTSEHEYMKAPSLTSCRRLKVLDIRNGLLPLGSLLLMTSLHTLAMPQPITIYSWSYVIGLLQHPALKILTLRDHSFNLYRKMDVDVPRQGFRSNVTDLTIPLEVFDIGLDFWLDLWAGNKNLLRLCITCYPYVRFDKLLKKLVSHLNFPKYLKRIYICGFAIDCKDLKSNFSFAIHQLQKKTDYIKCWYDGDAYRIELIRKERDVSQ